MRIVLLLLLAVVASGSTLNCSLAIGGIAVQTTVTPYSCSAIGPNYISAGAGYGSIGAHGQSSQALAATASMLDAITITGLTAPATFAYHITSDCNLAPGYCAGDATGWNFVPVVNGQTVPLRLAIQVSDFSKVLPDMLATSESIDKMTTLKVCCDIPLSPAFAKGDFSVFGVSYATESGHQYSYIYGHMPEPASLVLVGVGLIAVGLWRFRRRAR